MVRFGSEDNRHKLIRAITRYANRIVTGDVPQILASSFASALLVHLLKPNGDIRPIGVGGTMRRLIGKTALRYFLAKILPFQPLQLGVGTSGGAEAIVHAVTELSEKMIDDPDTIALLVDNVNAFGECLFGPG